MVYVVNSAQTFKCLKLHVLTLNAPLEAQFEISLEATTKMQTPVMCWCNGNGGTLQPLGWRFESPRTNIHVVPKNGGLCP